MKKLLFILTLALGVLATQAQVTTTTFAGQGDTQSGTNTWFLVPAGPGNARIEFINAATDKATAYISFFTNRAAAIVLTNTPAAGTSNITFTSNSTLTNGDALVIRHQTGATYKYNVGSATGTNVFLTRPLSNAVVSGDVLNEYALAGRVAWPATTNSLNAAGSGIFNGPWGQPVLVELDSTSAGALNVVSGSYSR